MSAVPFISIEGPIGIGKTSLTNILAEVFDFGVLKEIVEENPFLGRFYSDVGEWSFQTEMFFLCNRYKQLSDIQKNLLSENKAVISDYHIFKNLIFARRTLKESDYAKYVDIYNILTRDVPVPNMVIYINASVETIMGRIAMRGRDIEKQISTKYISQLVDDYHEFIADFEMEHPEVPVIRINGDELDFVNKQSDMSAIINLIEKKIIVEGFDLKHVK